ncbi:MAG TPA: hypothetical protein VF121_05285 [Thermoanaerobaculia bacterium]|nr:hypothetical protein [Thermoanaerobaculia bacterium]
MPRRFLSAGAGLALAAAFVLACTAAVAPARRGREHPSRGAASALPPGGLAVAEVPQFVQFGFDDNGISGREGSATRGGVRFVTNLFAGRRNPPGRGEPRTYDGGPALFSLYVATRYIEAPEVDSPAHVKLAWRAAFDAGHEIGLHTHSHPHGTYFEAAEWSEEIAACLRWLGKPFAPGSAADSATGIGLARQDVVGFRAPFLEFNPPLFAALRAHGIAYDCSVEEGFAEAYDGANLLWPYRIASGYGGGWRGIRRELWEIPVYALTVPPDEACPRYGVPPGLRARLHAVRADFDPADGKITGFDWNLWVELGMTRPEVVATWKYSLDRRLAGNRAPLTFGAHSDIYSEEYRGAAATTAEERRRALAEILDYALRRPEVRVVTAKQLLAWLRDPAPL